MNHIKEIKIIYVNGFVDNVSQFILPLYQDPLSINKVEVVCSSGDVISIDLTELHNFGDVYLNKIYKQLDGVFGITHTEFCVYFVVYSELQINWLDQFKISESEHFIVPEIQDAYLKWTSSENRKSDNALVLNFISNGVAVPLQGDDVNTKIYNFDFLNIIEIFKKVILEHKSAFVRLCEYDAYLDSSFRFKSGIRVIKSNGVHGLALYAFSNMDFETKIKYTMPTEQFERFRLYLLKEKLLG